MKMRASLRLRAPEEGQPRPTVEEVREWLNAHGISVLRVGRHALSIEAERDTLSEVVAVTLPSDGPHAVRIDKDQAAAGEWFDLLEYSPPPTYFRSSAG